MGCGPLSRANVSTLKDLAVQRGVKREGFGWAVCCPPRGQKADVRAALTKHVRAETSPYDTEFPRLARLAPNESDRATRKSVSVGQRAYMFIQTGLHVGHVFQAIFVGGPVFGMVVFLVLVMN